jgi:hypothetical protein
VETTHTAAIRTRPRATGFTRSFLARLALLSASLGMAVAFAQSASAQSYLNGYWNPLYDEDYDERVPGPDQGEYAGLPITPAAASVAHTWDPERLTLPELQRRPHPSIYGFRGIGLLRIWEDRDPFTQRQTQIETWIVWQSQHRHIWMDARHPRPTPTDPKTWQGYSVGHWEGDVLVVHTEGVKAAWTRRNGLPTEDQSTMDERFFRDDDMLSHIMMISDPQYLSEPLVKSNEFVLVKNAAMEPYPCSAAEEIPRAQGIVPMHLPGPNPLIQEWAVRHQVPLQAADGGAQTMLPEYQDAMLKMPPNPPLSAIEQAEKRIINGQEP